MLIDVRDANAKSNITIAEQVQKDTPLSPLNPIRSTLKLAYQVVILLKEVQLCVSI